VHAPGFSSDHFIYLINKKYFKFTAKDKESAGIFLLIIELCSCVLLLKQTSTMMRIDNVVVTSGIKLILSVCCGLAFVETEARRRKRRAMPHPLDVY